MSDEEEVPDDAEMDDADEEGWGSDFYDDE